MTVLQDLPARLLQIGDYLILVPLLILLDLLSGLGKQKVTGIAESEEQLIRVADVR